MPRHVTSAHYGGRRSSKDSAPSFSAQHKWNARAAASELAPAEPATSIAAHLREVGPDLQGRQVALRRMLQIAHVPVNDTCAPQPRGLLCTGGGPYLGLKPSSLDMAHCYVSS